jgi:hypothetical protein
MRTRSLVRSTPWPQPSGRRSLRVGPYPARGRDLAQRRQVTEFILTWRDRFLDRCNLSIMFSLNKHSSKGTLPGNIAQVLREGAHDDVCEGFLPCAAHWSPFLATRHSFPTGHRLVAPRDLPPAENWVRSACQIPPWFVVSFYLSTTSTRANWLCSAWFNYGLQQFLRSRFMGAPASAVSGTAWMRDSGAERPSSA